MRRIEAWLAGLCLCLPLAAQQPAATPELREILDRLSRLEQQNRELTEQVRTLQEQLGVSTPAATESVTSAPLAERVEVAERRVADLEQTHVATENRLPISLTGMLLFNSFLNGPASGGAQYPLVASATGRSATGGATFRQTVIGLRADGPTVLGGGKVRGSIFMDFFSGNSGLAQTMRVRTANIEVAWKRTTVGVAFDKPLIAQRDPDSLAQVGVSPLTASGNLWLWQPQIRLEQRANWNANGGVKAQFSVYQTSESGTGLSTLYGDSLATARPGYETRIELWKSSGTRRVEIAPGFHGSSTRVVGRSAPSRIGSVDWLIRPFSKVQLTGTYFFGQNNGVIGGLRQGVTVFEGAGGIYNVRAVRSQGGWAQLKLTATKRTSFNLFGGQQDDRNRDLLRDGIFKNQTYGANLMHRWGPNLMMSFETSETRTTYSTGTRLNHHYDLAFAYLF